MCTVNGSENSSERVWQQAWGHLDVAGKKSRQCLTTPNHYVHTFIRCTQTPASTYTDTHVHSHTYTLAHTFRHSSCSPGLRYAIPVNYHYYRLYGQQYMHRLMLNLCQCHRKLQRLGYQSSLSDRSHVIENIKKGLISGGRLPMEIQFNMNFLGTHECLICKQNTDKLYSKYKQIFPE